MLMDHLNDPVCFLSYAAFQSSYDLANADHFTWALEVTVCINFKGFALSMTGYNIYYTVTLFFL